MSSETWTVILGAVAALIGVAVPLWIKLSGHWHSQRADNRKQLTEERREVVDDLRELLEESRAECHELRERLNKKSLECTLCQITRSRLEERIFYLQDLLTSRKIPFPRWQPDDSSPSLDVQD